MYKIITQKKPLRARTEDSGTESTGITKTSLSIII